MIHPKVISSTVEYPNGDIKVHYKSFEIHQVKPKKSILADVSFGGMIYNDFNNGKHGYSKARKGVKKFINSRIRFHENQQTKKELKNAENTNVL